MVTFLMMKELIVIPDYANGNPHKSRFLLSSDNSKMCFECPQNRFKTLETILPAPLIVGGNLTSKS